MARPSSVSAGEKIKSAKTNEIIVDLVSKTDPAAQSVEGDFRVKGNLIVDGSLAFGAKGIASGASPITQAHGLTGVTSSNTVVFLCPMAAQPYTFSYTIDATNITIRHNAAGSLTFSWFAFKIT